MKRIYLTIILVVSALAQTTISLAATTPAASILKKTADNMTSSPSIIAKFSMSEGASVSKGSLKIAADKFIISIENGGITTWYDGKDQWVYNPKTDEMNISSPTPDELATINPFVILTSLQKAYSSKLLKSPAGKYVVELLPLDKKAEIRKAVITIDKRYLPTEATLTFSNGHVIKISTTLISKGEKMSISNFRPDKKRYSTAEWIDLR